MKLFLPFLFLLFILISITYSSSAQEYILNQDLDATTINACSGTLYDSGGPTGSYSGGEDYVVTITPDQANTNIQLYFSEFYLENSSCDNISI